MQRVLLGIMLLCVLCGANAHAQLRVSTSDGAITFNGVTELIFPPGSVTVNNRQARIGAGGGSGIPGSGITRLNGMIGGTQTFSFANDTNVTLSITSASNVHTFTLGWTGALATGRGGTNKTSWTSGSIPFLSSSTQFGEDNSNLFWDASNHRLGIGTTSPGAALHVKGGRSYFESATNSANYSMAFANNASNFLYVYDDGAGGIHFTDTSGYSAGHYILSLLQNRNVGVGTNAPARELEVNGGVRLNTVTSKPTCNSGNRGTFWVTQGGAGVKDAVEVCAKDAADAYAWRTIY